MSDGAVYFTLNGIWLGCPPNNEKIAHNSQVYSVVTAVGFDAHIKFFFDPSSFLFIPAEPEFKVSHFAIK
jgi:hypothetical protein